MSSRRFFVVLLLPLLLCACQGGYQTYLPAPHEMAVNAALAGEVKHVPEDQVRVQESFFVASDVQQALMKARGYIYIGQRNIRSEYAPSASSIRKAASEIGASQAVYFVAQKETVREKRSKMEFGNLVSDLIGSRSLNDLQRAGERATKVRDRTENVTYYTYTITYWLKDEGGQATILTKSESLLLMDEMKKLQQEMRSVSKKISKMERKNPDIRTAAQYVHTTTVVNQYDDDFKMEFYNSVQLQKKLSQQIEELRVAVATYKEREKTMGVSKGGSNPLDSEYDLFRHRR